jgi:NitT/TauT family transport system ATP-binding protein
MDEPFGALDAMTRQHLQQELLREWMASCRTVLFVTHDVDEAILLSSRVLVMTPHPGSIAADIEIPFDYPRDLGVSLSPKFLDIKRTILSLLGIVSAKPKAALR